MIKEYEEKKIEKKSMKQILLLSGTGKNILLHYLI